MNLELNFGGEKDNLGSLNETLRGAVEALENSFKLTREDRSLINDSIANWLKKYVSSNGLSECYYVKNVTPESNICFVHTFTADKKSFQNLELSKLSADVKNGDVLIFQNGSFKVDKEATNEILTLRKRIIEASKNSRSLFEVDGKEYFVCDKSDEKEDARMSLKIPETGKEFWGIKISQELYEKIRYGSKVIYQNGTYICVE